MSILDLFLTKKSLDETKPIIKEIDNRVNKFLYLIPSELQDYVKSLSEYELSRKLLNKIRPNFLPFHFVMNTRGGWITPDANWYLETTSSDTDILMKRRLIDIKGLNQSAIRAKAFKEGWVRIDYNQPIFSQKFSEKLDQTKVLSFTFNLSALTKQRIFWALEQIIILYDLAIPQNHTFLYEINLVSFKDDKMVIEKTRYRGASFAILALQTLKSKAR